MPGRIKVLEKDVQRAVVVALRLAGYRVYDLSQPRATMQTPGISDLVALAPGKPVLFVEVKTPTGSLSPAQEAFRVVCALVPHCRYLVARSGADLLAQLEAA